MDLDVYVPHASSPLRGRAVTRAVARAERMVLCTADDILSGKVHRSDVCAVDDAATSLDFDDPVYISRAAYAALKWSATYTVRPVDGTASSSISETCASDALSWWAVLKGIPDDYLIIDNGSVVELRENGGWSAAFGKLIAYTVKTELDA